MSSSAEHDESDQNYQVAKKGITALAPPAILRNVSSLATHSGMRTCLIYELHGFFALNAPNGADLLVVEKHSVEFIRGHEHLRAESSRDKLGSGGEVMDHCCRSVEYFSLSLILGNIPATAVRYWASKLASIYER